MRSVVVGKKYVKLDNNGKGGVLFLFLTLLEIFQVSKEMKSAFKNIRIVKYDRENVSLAAEQLLGFCKRLNAVGALTEYYLYDVKV